MLGVIKTVFYCVAGKTDTDIITLTVPIKKCQMYILTNKSLFADPRPKYLREKKRRKNL